MKTNLILKTAIFNLLLAAGIGSLLRFAFVEEVSWLQFRNWLHGHSHVAMLGWVFLALYAFLIAAFLPPDKRTRKYNWLFWALQGSVIGMLVSFPLQGYGAVSIAFSTLHLLLSYFFVFFVWRDLPVASSEHRFSRLFLKTSLFFLVLSTLSLWAMPLILTSGFGRTIWYYLSVQFFLHFQFNGWFLFALLALFFRLTENRGISWPRSLGFTFYLLLSVSTVLTFALAVAWSQPSWIVFLVNSLGVVIQLAATVLLIQLFAGKAKALKSIFQSNMARNLFALALICFLGKVLIQTSVALPVVATAAYTIRNFVIAFIHLILLGVVSVFLFGWAVEKKFFNPQSTALRSGLIAFLTGFVLTEGMLFLQGTLFWGAFGFIPYYYEVLFVFTLLLPVGIGLILFSLLKDGIVRPLSTSVHR